MRRMRNKLLLIIMRTFFISESFLQFVLLKGLFVFDLFSSQKGRIQKCQENVPYLAYVKKFYGYAPTKTGALISYLVKGVFEKRSHRQGNPCKYALQIKLSENNANLGSLNRDGEQHSLRRNSHGKQ